MLIKVWIILNINLRLSCNYLKWDKYLIYSIFNIIIEKLPKYEINVKVDF
jgi:hypothetical protein